MKHDPIQKLTSQDLQDLTQWRHMLHQAPEVSGQEGATAAAVIAALGPLSPTQIVSGLGGHGVAAVFAGVDPGPTVMIRAELDALPISEAPGPAHISRHPGVAHLCGHDGHMATLMGVARLLSRRPPKRGRAILLFQPSEENGAGAAAVLADPDFAPLRPDWAFALHNMPGLPLGQVQVAAGPANCASVGLCLRLSGRTAHAATPETGLSPARAMSDLIPALSALGTGGALGPDFRLVTLTHARLGEPAFGISPSEAEVWATLRTLQDRDMAALKDQAVALAQDICTHYGLTLSRSWHDDFAACVNDEEAVAYIQAVTDWVTPTEPMRASEDFGRFRGPQTRSAMFLLGAGPQTPALHSPDYDFPDGLIGQGAAIFRAILHEILG